MWLSMGEWVLIHRWWLVALASFIVIFFEYLEYELFRRGINLRFFYEILFYGVVLPVSTGLALTALAASRSELAWSIYYQNLKHNLERQFHNAHTHAELAEIFIQFVRVIMPVIDVTVYKYDRNSNRYITVLNWFLEKDSSFSDLPIQCTAERCSLLGANVGEDLIGLQPCRDITIPASFGSATCFCIPFMFSDTRVAAARLQFAPRSVPSHEQVRLLNEIAPVIGAAFQRIELEDIVKKREDRESTEQQRIARDVHDSLGHSLAYLRLRLDQMSTELNQTQLNTLRQEVKALRDVAKEAYDQMRELLIALSPNSNFNLSNMLVNYAERISQRANFKVQIQQHGKQQTLLPLIQRNIFYIFQEALTNIEKHAHAHQVNVNIDWQENGLALHIRDDGIGYDSSLQIPDGHFGLIHMRQRTVESSAQLSISSQLGLGTLISLYVPYEENYEIVDR